MTPEEMMLPREAMILPSIAVRMFDGERYIQYLNSSLQMILTTDYDTVRIGSFPEIYSQVGHKGGTFVDFWIFNKGNLEVYSDWPSNFNHEDFWKELPVESMYRGRYDSSNNWLSLTPPYRFKQREIPSSLLAQLERKFPGAELRVFDA